MTVTDVGVVLSFLAMVVVVAKMLRAFRLLEARVSLLEEQVERNHGAVQKAVEKTRIAATNAPRPPSRTPVLGVPTAGANDTPRPLTVSPPDETRPRNEGAGAGAPEPSDDEVAWQWLQQEQQRLKDAMGRDFQARKQARSAAEVRGNPATRMLSARDLAAKLERR